MTHQTDLINAKKYKMKKTFKIAQAILLMVVMASCAGKEQPKLIGFAPEDMPSVKAPDGETKTYYKSGGVEYVIPVVNGKANGLVKRYYENGKLYNETEYKDGLKNGKCTYYFPFGKVFSTVNYVNGSKEGPEIKYYDDGNKASECEYKEGKLLPGVKEFNKDGSLAVNNVSIIVNTVDKRSTERKFLVRTTLSDPKLVPYFYMTGLTSDNKRVRLKMIGATGEAEFSLAPGSFVKRNLLIEAEYKSNLGNTLSVQRKYQLVIQ